MKKNVYSIFLALAAIVFLASCNKNEVKSEKEHVIVDGKIMLTAGVNKMTPEGKYSFNASGSATNPVPSSFFDLNDSVYINGLPYAVFPYSTEYPETDTASAHARIWADISASGEYKGLYPKSAFASNLTDANHPAVVFPDTVKAFPTEMFFLGSIFRINPQQDGRVMPMTAYVTNDAINDNLQFHNTIGMFLLSLKYNYAFAAQIDPMASSGVGYPYLEVTRVEITTPNFPIQGAGTIANPYSSTPALTINSDQGHKVVYTLDATLGIQPTQRGATDLMFLPSVPFPTTRATVDIYFTTHAIHSGETHHFVYSKTINNKLHCERNTINNLIVSFSNAADFANCTQID